MALSSRSVACSPAGGVSCARSGPARSFAAKVLGPILSSERQGTSAGADDGGGGDDDDASDATESGRQLRAIGLMPGCRCGGVEGVGGWVAIRPDEVGEILGS